MCSVSSQVRSSLDVVFRSIASRQTASRGDRRLDHADRHHHSVIDARLVREARRFVTIGFEGSDEPAESTWPHAFCGGRIRRHGLSVERRLAAPHLVAVDDQKIPARFTLDNFTLDYWIGRDLDTIALKTGILLSPDLWDAAKNTLTMSASPR